MFISKLPTPCYFCYSSQKELRHVIPPSITVISFYILPIMNMYSNFFISLPTFAILCFVFFFFLYPDGCEVVSHCGFDLNFPNDSDIENTCGCLVAQSCPTLCDPIDCSLPGSSVHGDSPGENTDVDCQGIFPTQGSHQGLLHCRWILY